MQLSVADRPLHCIQLATSTTLPYRPSPPAPTHTYSAFARHLSGQSVLGQLAQSRHTASHPGHASGEPLLLQASKALQLRLL